MRRMQLTAIVFLHFIDQWQKYHSIWKPVSECTENGTRGFHFYDTSIIPNIRGSDTSSRLLSSHRNRIWGEKGSAPRSIDSFWSFSSSHTGGCSCQTSVGQALSSSQRLDGAFSFSARRATSSPLVTSLSQTPSETTEHTNHSALFSSKTFVLSWRFVQKKGINVEKQSQFGNSLVICPKFRVLSRETRTFFMTLKIPCDFFCNIVLRFELELFVIVVSVYFAVFIIGHKKYLAVLCIY